MIETYGNKKTSAQRLIREFSDKNWKQRGIKKLSRKVHKSGLLDLTGSGRPRTSCSCVVQPGALMVQLTNGQHTCQLVFKPKADILNITLWQSVCFLCTWWTLRFTSCLLHHLLVQECIIKVMFYFHKVAYVQYLGEVDIFSYVSKTFLPLYNSAKIIKIDRDFPQLWSQMYCHFLWFTVYMYFAQSAICVYNDNVDYSILFVV